MTPAARVQAAIDILATLEATSQPLDRFLRDYFRTRRYAGAKDRRAVADRVFTVMRHRSAFAHRMGSEAPRALVIASLLAEGEHPEVLFTGGYGPLPLDARECAAIAVPTANAPPHVAGEYPQWLEHSLRRAYGDALAAETAALTARAPADLRVNTLKSTRVAVLEALAGLGAVPAPYAPSGIRIAPGAETALSATALYKEGVFEFQDEAAQIAACLCGSAPGARVLDLAAGAGGKTLALAAEMANRGEIVACDMRLSALEELRRRAVRAGVSIVRTTAAPEGQFGIVLLDTPCSGSGTWRRQPELRWRLTPQRLAELVAIQQGLLDRAALHTAPGGRLVYVTCSLLPEENEDQVAAFLERHPAFRPLGVSGLWRGDPVPGLGTNFRASPARTGTDGFFCAVLGRS